MNTIAASAPRASRTGPLAWVLLAQSAALVSLVPWVLVAGFSFLAFDATAAEQALLPQPLLFALWAYPLLPVVCGAVTWRAWRRGDVRGAMRWSGVELAGALVVLGFVGFLIAPVG
jgi:hypothetical protein